MIESSKLNVKIGRRTILHDVDFHAFAGSVTVIVGPNGSGKSTLLKALCDEITYEGLVKINGKDIQTIKPFEMAALRGVMPQSSNLSFPFTVGEIVALGAQCPHPSIEGKSLPDMALERVELSGYGRRYYQELSGGEQARVQLARVLCQIWQPVIDKKPRWLILDEPVASLDIRHQLLVMNIARDYAMQGGGVIAILHDLNLTAHYADQVALMHGGRIVVQGDPALVLKDDILREIYGCLLHVGRTPPAGTTFILPQLTELYK